MTSEAQHSDPHRRRGLFDSIKTLTATLLAIAQTRLSLLATELEEERLRLTSMLVWTFVALFCAGCGAIFAALLIVVALWDTNRLLAVGIPAIVFLLGAALAWLIVMGKAKAKTRLFAASLAELGKDRERLNLRP
jgi:uncharacterized membrane protein YqjE